MVYGEVSIVCSIWVRKTEFEFEIRMIVTLTKERRSVYSEQIKYRFTE